MKSLTTATTVGLALVFAVACGAQGSTAGSDSAAEPAGAVAPQAKPPAAQPAQPPAPKAPTAAPAPANPQGPPANEVGVATKAFMDRIAEYVKFHNNVEKMVPPLKETSDPAKIADREKALGAALIKQRPDAKQGDFFIPVYQPILAKIIRDDFAKRSMADRKALIVELPKGVKVTVNSVYPTTLPLATFPANLLKVVPELPPELEYRIVGRDLMLRDVTGNVVVDIMPNIFPIPS